MKFAKIVFRVAGIYGVLVLAPLYFLYDTVGRLDPPPVTHPQFYYGFAGLGLVWQVAFLMIGSQPARLRPMMIPAILEKASYAIAVLVLFVQGRLGVQPLVTGGIDGLLGVLFAVAYFKTSPAVRVAAAF
jgi:hypothetical protein